MMTYAGTPGAAAVRRFLAAALLTLVLAASPAVAGVATDGDDAAPLGVNGLVLGMTKAEVLALGLTACAPSKVPFMNEECTRPANGPAFSAGGHVVDYVAVWLLDERVHGIGLYITGSEQVFDDVRAAMGSRYGALSTPTSRIRDAIQELATQALLPDGWVGVRWTRSLQNTASPVVFLLIKSPTFMSLGATRDAEHTKQR
jgi:hypothetical protein